MGFTIKHNKSTSIIPANRVGCKAHNITEVLSSEAWKGRKCFLLGGGPSLKNFNFEFIKNELTIGINKAFIKYPSTVNYAMDDRFYNMVSSSSKKDIEKKNLHQQWIGYKGIKVFPKRSSKSVLDDSVYAVNVLPEIALSFNLGKGIWLGNNSGFGALALACCLGAIQIGLLGYDLKVDTIASKTHWHGGYENQPFNSFQRKLDRFKKCFEEFAETIAQQGILVTNLNLNSALECFPKDTIENFLKSTST